MKRIQLNRVVFLFISLTLPLLVFTHFNDQASAQTTRVIAVAGGEDHSVGLQENGTVWTWGTNANGTLGIGTGEAQSTHPVQVIDTADPTGYLTGITRIAAGAQYWFGSHTLALKNNGTVWSWGGNRFGQVGDGTQENRSAPVQVIDPSDASGFLTGIRAIGAGMTHSLARKEDGTVRAWGDTSYGKLGDGNNTWQGWNGTPVQVEDPSDPSGFLTDVAVVTGGGHHSLVLKTDRSVWAWGSGGYGQLGDGTYFAKVYPVRVIDPADATGYLTDVVAIASGGNHCLALKSDGTVWAWGYNLDGQLGNGTGGSGNWRATPGKVLDPGDPMGYLTGVIAIAAGDLTSMALKGDRTVWTWGYNPYGELGDGSVTTRTLPVQVTGLSGVATMDGGTHHSLAVKTDGTVWAWGGNWAGQLGNGTTLQSTTPVQTFFLDRPKRLLSVRGPSILVNGEVVTYYIEYENILGQVLDDALVLFDLPERFTYVSSTGNGIYRDDRHQVFWKLGDLAPDATSHVTVKIKVPWGIPVHTDITSFVNLTARNIAVHVNVDDYLNYSDIRVTSDKNLTPAEIQALLAFDQGLRQLFDHALSKGFVFDNVAKQLGFSDGKGAEVLTLLDPQDFGPVFITRTEGSSIIVKYHENTISILDTEGGFSLDPNAGTFNSWGSWAEHQSSSEAECVNNCVVMTSPGFYKGIRERYKASAGLGRSCLICQASIKDQQRDNQACGVCAMEFVLAYIETHEPERVDEWGYPIYNRKFQKLYDCWSQCATNKNTWDCGGDYTSCGFSSGGANPFAAPRQAVVLNVCQKNVSPAGSKYLSPPVVKEECTHTCSYYPTVHCAIPCDTTPSRLQANDLCETNLTPVEGETQQGGDPNAKSVNFKGNVIPGQLLTYTVEYENVGQGTAYGVFILDKLDTDLNENTLIINNGGSYSAPTRLLGWDIGTVAPAGKGSVTFSVRVKDGLASGTEIVNHADVYFPSSSEITPTNAVVSIVRTIAADPKTVETTSGTPVPITLTGSDSGSAAITYRVTTGPLYGALSGILPSAVYTSMAAFTGQDEFYYVVNNGTVDSDPARVTIRVNPNPADTTAPAVASTWPAAETRSVHIDPNAIAPSRYIPTITATFSEGLDATTVTASTFTVGGLTGTVSYYDETRTAYFVPSTALAYSTVYTAQITTGVKDKNGNAMGASYTWQFTTESPANISVALSNNAEILAFGSILTGYSIPGMTVSILSTGSINLTLGAIEKAGTNPDEFEVSQDSCTGQTLEHFANCTLKVAFRPRSAGPKTAELSIGSNDADENPKLVSMTGTGFAFNDVPFPYWAGNHINSLFRSGITAGCSTDPPMFCPDNTINRWQMAVFMETSLGRAPAATCTDMFSDVNARTVGDLVCRYIEDFAAAGITGGCGEGRFCPHEPVTRAQMAVFIEAALGRSPATSCAGRFNDVSIGGVGEAFCRFIEDFADQGITGGCPASPPMFCPNAPVTRAQMAIFLVAAPPPLSP